MLIFLVTIQEKIKCLEKLFYLIIVLYQIKKVVQKNFDIPINKKYKFKQNIMNLNNLNQTIDNILKNYNKEKIISKI